MRMAISTWISTKGRAMISGAFWIKAVTIPLVGGSQPASGSGGSNNAMADGSARFIKFPQSVYPVNMWAVTVAGRTNYAISYGN